MSAVAAIDYALEEPSQADWRAAIMKVRARERSRDLRRAAAIKRQVALMNEELDALAEFLQLQALVQIRLEALRREQWSMIEELTEIDERLERWANLGR